MHQHIIQRALGAIIIAWEVTSALALVAAALYFVPRYLKMGLTTIPQFLEARFDGLMRTIIAFLVILSLVTTLLPIVLYTGAINIESIFEISQILDVSKKEGLWITVVVVGFIDLCCLWRIENGGLYRHDQWSRTLDRGLGRTVDCAISYW
jgi:uncharacterized sodium:solute symporter family permease YidK